MLETGTVYPSVHFYWSIKFTVIWCSPGNGNQRDKGYSHMRAKFCRFRKQEQQEAPRMVCEMHGNSWKEANAAQLLGLDVIVGCSGNYTSVSVLQLNLLMHYHIFLGLLRESVTSLLVIWRR
jgi:hypothetical protein